MALYSKTGADNVVDCHSPLSVNTEQSFGTMSSQASAKSLSRDTGHEETIPSAQEKVMSPARFKVIVVILIVGSFLAALDGTVTATLTITLLEIFKDPSLLSWMGSAYWMSCAIIQPICGQACDVFSRRAVMMFSLTMFSAGNLVVALSHSPGPLILGRVLSGIGGGSMGTVASVIMTDMVPHSKRGFWQGLLNIAFGLGHGLGGTLGGIANEFLSWRMAFWAQAPITMLLSFGVFMVPPPDQLPNETVGEDSIRIPGLDVKGSILITLGLASLLWSVNDATFRQHSGISFATITTTTIAIFCMIAFIWHGLRHKSPVLPIRALGNSTIFSVCVSSGLISAGFTGVEYFLPVLLQIRLRSTAASGLRMIAISAGGASGSMMTGLWLKSHPDTSRSSLTCFGLLAMASLSVSSKLTMAKLTLVCLAGFQMGFGYAGALTATLVELIGSLNDRRDAATITSLCYTFRHTGSAFGIALTASVFRYRLAHELRQTLGNVPPQIIDRLTDCPDYRFEMPEHSRWRIEESYESALGTTYLGAAACCIIGCVLYWICGMKSRCLTRQNGYTQ